MDSGRRVAGAECLLLHPSAASGGRTRTAPSPPHDPYETGFTTGQRNIFRQSFQKRADASLVKITSFSERYSLKYTFDVYNLTNTTSFDVPGNEVSQNAVLQSRSRQRAQPRLPYRLRRPVEPKPTAAFMHCPSGLGIVTHTIGSPRQIQMSLHFDF